MRYKKNELKKLILKEMGMLSIIPMNMNQFEKSSEFDEDSGCGCSMSPCGCDGYSDYDDYEVYDEQEYCQGCGMSPCSCMDYSVSKRGTMSKESCLIAIRALADCCNCAETKSIIINLCEKL